MSERIYVASRASIPERSQMWRDFRAAGYPIISTWIDEAGEGETGSYEELWTRIHTEIASSAFLVLYAESGDFPLKGALIEVGIALGLNLPIMACLPGVAVNHWNGRPVGSWLYHRNVYRNNIVEQALKQIYPEASL